ncbi:MAG: DUF1217 domain-containing protein [Acetobacteraceae bacterium]
MGTTISYLPSLFAWLTSNTSTTSSLLGTLYGTGTQPTTGFGENPVTALDQAEQNQTQDVAATAQQPAVQRAISQFTAAVQSATSPQQLLDNPTVMQVLLTANGLGDQTSYTALAQKTLLSDVNDPNSLANTLTDTRWKPVVQTYDFANKGLSIIQNPQVISTITNGFAEITWRQSLDATTPGLSNALTFRQNAPTVTTVDQILGDPVLRTVVTVTLGIPEQIAFQPLEAQEKAITSQLDISKLQDPHFVETFAQRYLIAAANSQSAGSATPSLTALAVQAQGLVV